jgi:cold shock CspA family protein
MQIPVQITEHGGQLSPEDRRRIERRAAALERYHDRIMGCRVAVTAPAHQAHGVPSAYQIRIDLTLPEGELAVNRQVKPSLTEAVQDAFQVARRQLQDFVRQQRQDVKRHEAAATGCVTRLLPYEGYGFLTAADGREIYFHRNSVVEDGFDRLTEGTDVRFVEVVGAEGPQASTVEPVHAVRARRRTPGS